MGMRPEAGTERALNKRPLAEDGTDIRAMTVATSLFFMWGFLTSLNDVMIPNLKVIFDLDFTRAMLVQFSFFSSYFIFALPAGSLVEHFGYKRTMIVGLVTMTFGALLFIPAARVPSFNFFLAALVVLAAGITALQVAANPYVANLGPERTASSRLNLAQAFNSFGTFLAPIFGGYLILSRTPKSTAATVLAEAGIHAARVREAASVQLPYLGIALTLTVLAIALTFINLPTIEFTRNIRPGQALSTTVDRLRDHPQLLLGVAGIFCYVGAEVAIGSFLISYLELPDIAHLSAARASVYVSLYWGGATVGRFIGAAILRRFSTGRVLAGAATVAASLVVASMLTTGYVAMISIIAVGLFNSVMFPSIFTLGIADLGPLTGRGSSLMVAAIVGGALIPLVQGRIADSAVGLHHAFLLPVLCYLYIAIFGWTRRSTSAHTHDQ
jgi:FHS family L-fucose permease-like MFS transporter